MDAEFTKFIFDIIKKQRRQIWDILACKAWRRIHALWRMFSSQFFSVSIGLSVTYIKNNKPRIINNKTNPDNHFITLYEQVLRSKSQAGSSCAKVNAIHL